MFFIDFRLACTCTYSGYRFGCTAGLMYHSSIADVHYSIGLLTVPQPLLLFGITVA